MGPEITQILFSSIFYLVWKSSSMVVIETQVLYADSLEFGLLSPMGMPGASAASYSWVDHDFFSIFCQFLAILLLGGSAGAS
jgi:hypothetical protein